MGQGRLAECMATENAVKNPQFKVNCMEHPTKAGFWRCLRIRSRGVFNDNPGEITCFTFTLKLRAQSGVNISYGECRRTHL